MGEPDWTGKNDRHIVMYVDGKPLGEFNPREMDETAAARRRGPGEPLRAIPPLPFKHPQPPHEEPSR